MTVCSRATLATYGAGSLFECLVFSVPRKSQVCVPRNCGARQLAAVVDRYGPTMGVPEPFREPRVGPHSFRRLPSGSTSNSDELNESQWTSAAAVQVSCSGKPTTDCVLPAGRVTVIGAISATQPFAAPSAFLSGASEGRTNAADAGDTDAMASVATTRIVAMTVIGRMAKPPLAVRSRTAVPEHNSVARSTTPPNVTRSCPRLGDDPDHLGLQVATLPGGWYLRGRIDLWLPIPA